MRNLQETSLRAGKGAHNPFHFSYCPEPAAQVPLSRSQQVATLPTAPDRKRSARPARPEGRRGTMPRQRKDKGGRLRMVYLLLAAGSLGSGGCLAVAAAGAAGAGAATYFYVKGKACQD